MIPACLNSRGTCTDRLPRSMPDLLFTTFGLPRNTPDLQRYAPRLIRLSQMMQRSQVSCHDRRLPHPPKNLKSFFKLAPSRKNVSVCVGEGCASTNVHKRTAKTGVPTVPTVAKNTRCCLNEIFRGFFSERLPSSCNSRSNENLGCIPGQG